MGYNRELPPKHPSCGNPGVTPLPVPYCPHFGSREPCHLYGKLDGNSNFFSQKPRRRQKRHTITPATTTTRGQTDLNISGLTEEDCHQPTEAQKGAAAAAEQEEAERRAAAHQRRAIPQVRYDTHRSSEHVHRTRANTQRQQHAAV